MIGFTEMMQRLQDGTFTDPIPHSVEKAGVITPAGLLRLAIHGSHDDPYTSSLLEAVSKVLDQVDDYVEKNILGDAKVLARAEGIIGTEVGPGEPPLDAEDLVLIRISWRMEQVGEQLNTAAWYFLKGAVVTDAENGTWDITWPVLHDEEAQFWPIRHLREAVRLCLFSGALRPPVTPTQH